MSDVEESRASAVGKKGQAVASPAAKTADVDEDAAIDPMDELLAKREARDKKEKKEKKEKKHKKDKKREHSTTVSEEGEVAADAGDEEKVDILDTSYRMLTRSGRSGGAARRAFAAEEGEEKQGVLHSVLSRELVLMSHAEEGSLRRC